MWAPPIGDGQGFGVHTASTMTTEPAETTATQPDGLVQSQSPAAGSCTCPPVHAVSMSPRQ
jgi:hypothetical protein